VACAKPSTCDCLCTKVDIGGLAYNGISYDATTAHLPPTAFTGCSCVISAVVPMKRTGSGTPGTFDNLTIRVELHDNCIMYAEATLAVTDNPVWSGRCTSINGFNCDNRRFSCGWTGWGGGIVLASRTVFGNNVTLTIDGDDCISYRYDRCDRPGSSGAWVRIGSDGGDCIIAGGVAYGKVTSPVQPTSGAITATPTIINITGQSFTYDDDNVNGGSNHNVWTPCEMGIANNLAVNQGAATGGWVDIYTAPSTGVIRVWALQYQNSRMDIKKNGTVILTNWLDFIGRAAAIRVVSGDVIAVYCRNQTYGWGTRAYSFFLPSVYP
jgi:hypothetical protein